MDDNGLGRHVVEGDQTAQQKATGELHGGTPQGMREPLQSKRVTPGADKIKLTRACTDNAHKKKKKERV